MKSIKVIFVIMIEIMITKKKYFIVSIQIIHDHMIIVSRISTIISYLLLYVDT